MDSGSRRNRAPTRSLKHLFILFVVVLAVALLGFYFWRSSQRGWTVEKVEEAIEQELSDECTQSDVEGWFAHHEFDSNLSTDPYSGRIGNQTHAEVAGLRPEQVGTIVWGMIYPANVHWFLDGHIDIYFFFGKSGQYLGHLVYPFIPSL